MDTYKILEAKEPRTTIDKNLIEIQKTIIYYGEKILEEIQKLKIDKNDIKRIESSENLSDPITTHLKNIIIPQNYGGNNLKW